VTAKPMQFVVKLPIYISPIKSCNWRIFDSRWKTSTTGQPFHHTVQQ